VRGSKVRPGAHEAAGMADYVYGSARLRSCKQLSVAGRWGCRAARGWRVAPQARAARVIGSRRSASRAQSASGCRRFSCC